jgi:hypothetical protein
MTNCMGCLPTSRGSITLGSNDPSVPPVIDPNYYPTGTDKHVMRKGFHMQSRLMLDTPEGIELIAEEYVPPRLAGAGLNASDEQIDERINVGRNNCISPHRYICYGQGGGWITEGLWGHKSSGCGC